MGNQLEAKAFTLEIVKSLKNHTDAWGSEFGYHFSVYATPSESLTDRFCKLDIEKFGLIPDITEKEYYTNSFHYDVRKIQLHLKRLNSRKITQCILQVVSSTTANIQSFVKIQRRWKPCGILPMTE